MDLLQDECAQAGSNSQELTSILDDSPISSTLPDTKALPSSVERSSGGQNEQKGDGGIVVPASQMPAELPSKKKSKKKSRPASKRGLQKPTGFEDNFADPPLTVEQHAELKELFSSELPFVDRILHAIHRFERTRKLSTQRRDVFHKYLSYSGFDSGPNMFQGQQDVTEMEKDKSASTMAQTRLSEEMKVSIYDPRLKRGAQKSSAYSASDVKQNSDDDNDDNDGIPGVDIRYLDEKYKYIIDFHTTMRAFLSRRAPAFFGMDTKEIINLVTTTLERFMDYLLQHDVCEEYAAEVLQTRNLCRDARVEMTSCLEVNQWLPGEFNLACSTLFDGSFSKNYDGETTWEDGRPGESMFVGLTTEKASQIIGFAMAAVADDMTYQAYADTIEEGGTFELATIICSHGFEITGIERATDDCCKIYKANSEDYRPVGKVHAKFWKNPEMPPEDLTEGERTALHLMTAEESKDSIAQSQIPDHDYTFFVEDSNILPHLRIGQKVECSIYRMKTGFWFFDEVLRLYPSFDIWIENELVYDWKPPKAITDRQLFAAADDDEEEKAQSMTLDSGNSIECRPAQVQTQTMEDETGTTANDEHPY